MPGWQALADELADGNFTVIGVALDDDPEAVRPFTDDISFPVLIDREHLLTELYAISNVPTVAWIDERDRIVRPNAVAFGTDMFKDFHGVDAETHQNEIRAWVRDGVVEITRDQAVAGVGDLSEDEVAARLRFRIAAHLRRTGDEAAAARVFAEAGALAPYDFTIRRAAMPLTGDDPFGQSFFDLYQEWEAAGTPYHGLPASRADRG